MQITRRTFLKYCSAASVALGLGPVELGGIADALANPESPSILWLQGNGCSGCSVSFMNFVSSTPPVDASDVLIHTINLAYHPIFSAAVGDLAVQTVYQAENFVLLVEGAVPTAFGGHACVPWSDGDKEITFDIAVKTLAAKARRVVSIGTCAAFGGIGAIGSNPTGSKSVRDAAGIATINISGCPPHPNWIVSTLLRILQGKEIPLDGNGRPTSIYGQRVHEQCPFEDRGEARSFGINGQCMERLGCQGPGTGASCPQHKWNSGINWCVAAGGLCLGCTEPAFPNPVPRGRGGGRGRGRRQG